MKSLGMFNLVFSSSATVYALPKTADDLPSKENSPLYPSSPYGRSKLMAEQVMQDASIADDAWNIAIFRYFNPVSAHPSGFIGESPQGTANNLMLFLTHVASGNIPKLTVLGDQFPTRDGSGIRDYVHVVDLA